MSKIGINGRQCAGREQVLGAPIFCISAHITDVAATRVILASPVGFGLRVLEVVATWRAACAGASVQLFTNAAGGAVGADLAVTDAVTYVAADTMARATTMDDTRAHYGIGDMMGLTVVVGAGTNDIDVMVYCVREDA